MPDDPTPHGGEARHAPPDRATIPQPRPGQASPGQTSDEPGHGQATAGSDPVERPTLPEHPTAMAADVEDEDADPVIDSGPGIADDAGKPSVTRQPA